jgi:hypothetical protein
VQGQWVWGDAIVAGKFAQRRHVSPQRLLCDAVDRVDEILHGSSVQPDLRQDLINPSRRLVQKVHPRRPVDAKGDEDDEHRRPD